MIKIDVISGFLGAGKTTLIKKLFESNAFKDEKIVLIENEFGQIGIDGGFLKDSGVAIKEMNSGCICCSLVGDFAESMLEVIEKFTPNRIIIEPSGVGKLSDIEQAIVGVKANIELNIVTTVVDGAKCKLYMKNFGEFFNNQVESANTIIVNKIDACKPEQIEDVISILKEKNPHANIVSTPISEFTGEKLLEILETKGKLQSCFEEEVVNEHKCCCHHEEHEHDHKCGCHHEEHEHDHECCCHHEEHEHDHECSCHHEEHEHDHECCCHHEEHEHDHECSCHHEEHEHEHECSCHHEEHEHDHECCCHHEEHEHDHECSCHHEEHEHEHECGCHHHHADEIFTSWGLETALPISRKELTYFLNRLATDATLGDVIRAKGILKASDADSWYYFDFVSGEYEIRLGNPDITGRLCVIGSKIDTKTIEEICKHRG